MARTILHQPTGLITLNEIKNITILDDDASVFADYQYINYLLQDPRDINQLTEYINDDGSTFTQISVTDGEGYDIGETIYFFDRSVAQLSGSGTYTIIEKLSANDFVINRTSLVAIFVAPACTLNKSIGFTKSPSYKDKTGTFLYDNKLVDLRIKSTETVFWNDDQFKILQPAITYSSKSQLGTETFNGLEYEETFTGVENPWLYLNAPNTTLDYAIGDVVQFVSGGTLTFCSPGNGISYSEEVVSGSDVVFLAIDISGADFEFTKLVYPNQTVYLAGSNSSVNPFLNLIGNHSVRSVDGDTMVLQTQLSTWQKFQIDDGSTYTYQSVYVRTKGLSRSGNFNVLDIKFTNGKTMIQISAAGLGMPTANTTLGPGSIYYNFDIKVEKLTQLSSDIQDKDVEALDDLYIIDSDNDEDFNKYVCRGQFGSSNWGVPLTDEVVDSDFDTIEVLGFNDLRWVNYIQVPNMIDNLQIRITPRAPFSTTIVANRAITQRDSISMLTIGSSPAQIIEDGLWLNNLGFPLTPDDFADNSWVLIRPTKSGSTTGFNFIYTYKDTCSIYKKMRLLFKDTLGSLNGINFTLGNVEVLSTDVKTYQSTNYKLNENYKYVKDDLLGGKTIARKTVTTSYQLISDWIPELSVITFTDMFRSNQVFLQIGDELTMAKCIIKEKSMEQKYTQRDGLIQYVINVEVSNMENVR